MKIDPNQVEKIRQEMNGIVADYYKSVEASFELSVKFFGKLHPFTKFVLTPITILFLFSILPLIPALANSLFSSVFPAQINLFGWKISISPFFYWWGMLAIITYPLYKVADKVDDKFREDRKSRTLQKAELLFCFLYSATNAIKSYQLNRRNPHLQHAEKMLKIYFDECEINLTAAQIKETITAKPELTSKKLFSTQLVTLLRKSHNWFVLSDRTNSIIEAFSNFASHLIKRVSQGIELDRVLIILEPLFLYEYSRVKRETITTLSSSSANLSDLSNEFLDQFALQACTLSALPKQEPTTPPKPIDSAYRKLWTKLTNILAHENPLTCFLSWYLLLLLIFSLPLFIVFVLLMPLDSTILIGIFSAPFAGAIAITAAVYTKKHDQNR